MLCLILGVYMVCVLGDMYLVCISFLQHKEVHIMHQLFQFGAPFFDAVAVEITMFKVC